MPIDNRRIQRAEEMARPEMAICGALLFTKDFFWFEAWVNFGVKKGKSFGKTGGG